MLRKRFEEELKELNDSILAMGSLIEEHIQQSLEALVKKDTELAKKIIKSDDLVDKKQREIESICFNLLIEQQPVAKDLRFITAALKLVTDMERIGDHAADISEIVLLLSQRERIEVSKTILKMASEASFMLIDSIDAFAKKDDKKAKEVIDYDDVVDNLFYEVKKELIELIKNHSDCGEEEIDLLMIAKYLERIADHATNIAEWVIYCVGNEEISEE